MGTVYSHPPEDGRPGVELREHLSDVARRTGYVVPTDATTPAGEPLDSVIETLAYVHDLGKATTFFQAYLLHDESPEEPEFRYHAPLGSFAAYYALDAQGFATETCLAGFVAVAKHHGRLPDVADYVHTAAYRRNDIDPGDQTAAERRQMGVAKQIEDIDEQAPVLAREVIDDATDNYGNWTSFQDRFGSLLREVAKTVATTGTAPGVDPETLSSSCYGLVLRCWSSLVFADKTSAAGADDEAGTYAAELPSLERLDEHVAEIEADANADPNGTRTEQLNYYRSQARETVLGNVGSFANAGGGVATITLPTGMGKTLTGLSAAFALRNRLGGERVVYALPFTSIIDQVVDEVEEIYDTDATGRLLTAHHHLAETIIREFDSDRNEDDTADAEAADRSDGVGAMLAESWRAGLTVTTFVQLFESLAGPGNRQSMKLPALRNSVVVLDEPQSLPLDWWKLVPRLITLLTEQYDATVIAMTATQPKLFGRAGETYDDSNEAIASDRLGAAGPTELVDDPDTYFDAAERVSYELHPSVERYLADGTDERPESYEHAADSLQKSAVAGESALAVCNTIDSARELTERTSDRIEGVDVAEVYTDVLSEVGNATNVDADTVARRVTNANNPALLHLSTRLRPADRLTLIEVAEKLTDWNYPLVTVSTQLIEAGVDISFDRVYRDLAPIDSIVQAAGRCNRSFERERGNVTVWWLDTPGDQNKTPAEAVYNRGPSLLPVAAATLDSVRGENGTLSESAVARTAVDQYYRRLHEEKDVGKQAYADYVDEARAAELGRLSLIDQRRAADVFVCRTDYDRALAERLREASQRYNFDALGQLLDETKPLRISVPYYREDSDTADAITDLPQLVEDEGLYCLDVHQYRSYFDPATGFVVPDGGVEHQFL